MIKHLSYLLSHMVVTNVPSHKLLFVLVVSTLGTNFTFAYVMNMIENNHMEAKFSVIESYVIW